MPLQEKHLRLIGAFVPQVAKMQDLSIFSRLYDRVVETNEKINITSLISPIDVTLKHIIDSLTLFFVPEFQSAIENKRICDIGCGGGFPGLPIASVAPKADLTMIDSTEKKIRALSENADLLDFSCVHPVWGRGEELAGKSGPMRERFDVCVSRAVARLPVLCELCLPFVKVGGIFIAMKGAKAQEELQASLRAIPTLGGKLEKTIPIEFSPEAIKDFGFDEAESEAIREFCQASRQLIIIRKVKPTPSIYPRKWSKMTSKTL